MIFLGQRNEYADKLHKCGPAGSSRRAVDFGVSDQKRGW